MTRREAAVSAASLALAALVTGPAVRPPAAFPVADGYRPPSRLLTPHHRQPSLSPSQEATPPRQAFEVPADAFKPLPGTNPPIMYYDIKGGGSTEGGARPGQRVAVHFDVKFRRITIATSRQGAGVTGGVPYGFQVGTPAGTPGGPFIKAFNEGIKGMGPGQFRRLLVPPEYAYGNQQVQEIPPNSMLTVDLELLSVAARA